CVTPPPRMASRPETIRPLPKVPAAAVEGIFVVLYLGGALWGKELADPSGSTAWYPPPGLAVALVVAFGLRYAPLVLFAEALSSVLIFDVEDSFTAAQIAVNATLIAFAYSVGPAILRAFAGNGPALRRPVSYWVFTGTCVVLGPLIAATG